MLLMYFVVVTLLFQLLNHVSDFLTSICTHVNDLSIHNNYTTLHPNRWLHNHKIVFTVAKTSHIDDTRPAPLSMNKLTAEFEIFL